MKRISKNWIVEPHLDFEYKKYSLLAYLQETERAYSSYNIYPHLRDLETCQNSILKVLNGRDEALKSFPSEIKRINTKPPRLEYETVVHDDGALREVEEIASFSLKHIEEAVDEGRSLIGRVKDRLDFFPVGVHSSWDDEGFLLVRRKPYVFTFKYLINRLANLGDGYPVHLKWLRRFKETSIDKLDQIKLELVRSESSFAPKAAFAVIGGDDLPLKGAILPLTTQRISHWVGQKKEG